MCFAYDVSGHEDDPTAPEPLEFFYMPVLDSTKVPYELENNEGEFVIDFFLHFNTNYIVSVWA